jgi:2-polyprenyl-3-methyl-5-hydroxy-6-metoxy-1,4-benzoquinol methylase
MNYIPHNPQTDKYESGNPVQKWLINRFLRKIDNFLDEDDEVLDLACGQGHVTKRLPKGAIGVDLDGEAIKYCKEHYPEHTFIHEDIRFYKQKEEVDVTLILEILEHLPDPEAALQNIYKIPSTYFLFSVPHEPWFQLGNLARGKHLIRLGNHPEHIQHWNKKTFEEFLSPHFTVVADHSSFPWIMYLCKKR